MTASDSHSGIVLPVSGAVSVDAGVALGVETGVCVGSGATACGAPVVADGAAGAGVGSAVGAVTGVGSRDDVGAVVTGGERRASVAASVSAAGLRGRAVDCGSLRVTAVSSVGTAGAFAAGEDGVVARGRRVRGEAVPGRTIFGASGTGICVACGAASASRPRTGAGCGVCSVCAAAGIALITVRLASRAARAPRSVVIVENPLRAVVAALWPGEAEPATTATRYATSCAWATMKRAVVRRGCGVRLEAWVPESEARVAVASLPRPIKFGLDLCQSGEVWMIRGCS